MAPFSRLRRPARVAAALIVAMLLLTGCQVDLEVTIDVADDGSGMVTVAVGLDEQALARVPDLATQLRKDDLEAAGWTVGELEQSDGRTWVRATKPFEDPSQLQAVLDEISGPDAFFQDFVLERGHTFGATSYDLTGVVDLSGGLATFGDADLAAALDGDPFGGNLAQIESEEGKPATEMVSVAVSVNLPGSDGPTVVRPAFSDGSPSTVEASSTVTDDAPKMWVALAVVCFLLAALVPVRSAYRKRKA